MKRKLVAAAAAGVMLLAAPGIAACASGPREPEKRNVTQSRMVEHKNITASLAGPYGTCGTLSSG